MEEKERCRSRSPARRTSRVQQVVGTIIRRTRESLSRERLLGDLGGRSQRSNSLSNQNFVVKLTVQITRDPVLDGTNGHGFTLTQQPPLLVRDVTTDGPADGLLCPGDQVLQINDIAADDANLEQLDVILGDLEDSITMTILRHMTNPKSSIMSAEKRARLRRNPIKVRFAEEVVVNGHTQGNSLLFLPNVLKVYLENGQTKAFKFDNTTTVKDIVVTLKDKLSIKAIEYFSLVLEQQYSITKLLLLHEDEPIIKVVQKKDSHDYRCLFRVCFLPRDPADLLHDDPEAFHYLFLQSVGDVLQERFAVEMKCNTALRLAALHMHERLDSCGQTRASIKSITKEFGLDSFISPTLLSNMREKDLRKAINHHLKKIQALLEPRQKVISANQARLAYLTQLGELISYGGRSYTATMMLQDREALVSLLVGSRYGMSQVINHKLNMISTLVEFSSVSRVELLNESDRVSLLRISLHDMKPFALLMDSIAAKDLGCLLGGYCRLLVEPGITVFRLGRPKVRVHRIVQSAEEGYVSRGCSDSNDSSDEDYPMESQQQSGGALRSFPDHSSQDWEERRREEEQRRREEERREREDNEGKQEVRIVVTVEGQEVEEEVDTGGGTGSDAVVAAAGSEAASWYHSDPRVTSSFSSLSSGSLCSAALEDTVAPPTAPPGGEGPISNATAATLDVHHPYLLEPQQRPQRLGQATAAGVLRPVNLNHRGNDNSCVCFSELSHDARPEDGFLPSPADATTDDDDDEEEEEEEEEEGAGLKTLRRISKIPSSRDLRMIDSMPFQRLSPSQSNNRKSQSNNRKKRKVPPAVPLRSSSIRADHAPFLTPSPPNPATAALLVREGVVREGVVRDSEESEDEFFDAQDSMTPPVSHLTETDRQNANRLSDSWNGLPSTSESKKKQAQTLRPASTQRTGQPQSSATTRTSPPPPPQTTSQKPPPTKPPLAPKPQLLPKPLLIPPRSPQRKVVPPPPGGSPQRKVVPPPPGGSPQRKVVPAPPGASPQRKLPPCGSPQRTPPRSPRQRSYAHCNGDVPSGSDLLEMEPDTMEVKSVTSGGLPPLASPLITAVRRSQQAATAPQKPQNPQNLHPAAPHHTHPAAPHPQEKKSRTVENGPKKQDNGPRVANNNHNADLLLLADKMADEATPVTNGFSSPWPKEQVSTNGFSSLWPREQVRSSRSEGGQEVRSSRSEGGQEVRSSRSEGGQEVRSSRSEGGQEVRSSRSEGGQESRSSRSEGGQEVRSSRSEGGQEVRSSRSEVGQEVRSSRSEVGQEVRSSRSEGGQEVRSSRSEGGQEVRSSRSEVGQESRTSAVAPPLPSIPRSGSGTALSLKLPPPPPPPKPALGNANATASLLHPLSLPASSPLASPSGEPLLHPLSLPATSPLASPIGDPLHGFFKDGVFKEGLSPPNGLLHPWGSRNGSAGSAGSGGGVQPGSRRVSLSHESLSPKNQDAPPPPLSLTTSLTSGSTSRGLDGGTAPGGPGALRSGSGSDLRTTSSASSLAGGRLPASALRGRIQALPWYMTRSQEILGTLDYPSSCSITSGFGSGLSVASGLSGASDLNRERESGASDLNRTQDVRERERELLDEDEGAAVVIATIKEAQEVNSCQHASSRGTNGAQRAAQGSSHTNLNFKERAAGGAVVVVSSEQPQSRPHSAVGLGGVSTVGGGDSESTPPQQQPCGCRTVYANCFSGEGGGAEEEGVGFDDDLTVYEFSRRTTAARGGATPFKPLNQSPSSAPPPPTTTAATNPNILSLLRDTPRPLSALSPASTELSPLVASSASRPVSPAGGAGLHSLSNKRYGALKGGFASLRHDIDQLAAVLERGGGGGGSNPLETPDPNHNHTGSCELQRGHNKNNGDFREVGGSAASSTASTGTGRCSNGSNPAAGGMTEAERTLLQTEARRLASGCQRATRVGWAPDEALRSLSNSFSALVQLSAACLQLSAACLGTSNTCRGCQACHGGGAEDLEEATEALDKMKEIVGLYRDFVGAVETAGTGRGGGGGGGGGAAGGGQGEGEGVRLLAKRCTVLISSVFTLTQLFRTRSVDTTQHHHQATPPGQVPLHF